MKTTNQDQVEGGKNLSTQPTISPRPALEWIKITTDVPTEGQIVETKIEDSKGTRNNALLVRHGGLWYFADESMYVYYTPTHWRKPLARDVQTELSKLAVTADSLESIRERIAATATRD